MPMKNILLTGATGVLGSELLYHLLYEKLVERRDLNIHLVVRPGEDQEPKDRINDLFRAELMPTGLSEFSSQQLVDSLHIINGDLSDFEFAPEGKFTLIHSAATVNLNNKEKTKELVVNNNYWASIKLVERFADKIEHMIFVSTAYSCGVIHGEVTDNYLDMNASDLEFRNYYEEYKFKAEQDIYKIAQKHNFSLSIVRPSIISGRLIVEPLFVMKRYIVFYLMGKFFMEVAKLRRHADELVRIKANKEAYLNVIPVDYVAKAIVRILRNPDVREMNLVSGKPFPMYKIVEKSMEMNGFSNLLFVDEEPEDKSAVEAVFYKTVAKQLLQYVEASHHTFDTSALREMMSDIPEPNIEEHFNELFEFAQARQYAN